MVELFSLVDNEECEEEENQHAEEDSAQGPMLDFLREPPLWQFPSEEIHAQNALGAAICPRTRF